jgi:hypothetical protein
MSNAIYPGDLRGLTWTVIKTSEASTIVQSSSSGVETRLANYQNPKWHWILQYSLLYDRPARLSPGYSTTEYRYLQGFFLARQGQFDDFLFDDPTDDSVGPAMLPGAGGPNLQAQLQVVNDGAGNFYSPVQRNFGGLFYEDVTDLGTSGITVFDNGAAKVAPADYQLLGPGLSIPGYSFAGPYLKWTAPPAGPVTTEFDFYFRVRFETDLQDFEQFQSDLWAIGGDGGVKGSGELKLVSARRTS